MCYLCYTLSIRNNSTKHIKKQITHKQIYQKNGWGGITNRTLCGKMQMSKFEENNGMNISEDFNCKLCLKNSKTHWGKILIQNSKEIKRNKFK